MAYEYYMKFRLANRYFDELSMAINHAVELAKICLERTDLSIYRVANDDVVYTNDQVRVLIK
jgi:hypothetical protein